MPIVYTVVPERGGWRVIASGDSAGRVIPGVFDDFARAVREALDRASQDRLRGRDAKALITVDGKQVRVP
jgi:hypothetical protein